MQAPGAPNEDTEGGFQHGGWAMQFMDQMNLESATKGMAERGGIVSYLTIKTDELSAEPVSVDENRYR